MVTGANFSHVCLRKMYVLCSRGGASLGGGTPGDDGLAACLLEVAQLALPVLLARCDAMLRTYMEEGPHAAASRWARLGVNTLPLLGLQCACVGRKQTNPMSKPTHFLPLGGAWRSSGPSRAPLCMPKLRAHLRCRSAAAAVPHRPRLDEVMCVLEVLASMTLVPEVVDAALTGNPPMQQVGGGKLGCGTLPFCCALHHT